MRAVKNFRLKPRAIATFVLLISMQSSIALAADEKIDLALQPPKSGNTIKCAISLPASEIENKWQSWNGRSDPGVSLDQLRADGKRLASLDAKKYFPVAAKIFEYLTKSKNEKISQQTGIDLARLYVDAERMNSDTAPIILPLIANGAAARNATSMLVLGEIYESGLGVDIDFSRAVGNYKSAAQLGQADALLKLVQLKLAGKDIGFNTDPTVAAKIAFSSMLQNEVPDPCFGIKRIARIYAKGTGIIKQSHALAAAWYQLAADSGDPDSAWTVSRYHLLGEDIVKNTEVLKHYLVLAAERGVPQAMIELGRVYEDGSLFPKNLDAARQWYEKASLKGVLSGSLRLANLNSKNGTPGSELEKQQAIVAKSALAPASALVDYAKTLTANYGRAEGGLKARPFLERAAALNNTDAIVALAGLDRLQSSNGSVGAELINRLQIQANAGEIAASLALADFYACKMSSSPDIIRMEKFESAVVDGSSNLGALVKRELAVPLSSLTKDEKRTRIGLLRTAAMRGVSDGLALLVDSYENSDVSTGDAKALAFWKTRLDQDPAALWRYAKLLSERGDDGAKDTAIQVWTRAVAMGNQLSAIDLATALATSQDILTREIKIQVSDLLAKPILSGRGAALELAITMLQPEEKAGFAKENNLLDVAFKKGDAHFAIALSEITDDKPTKDRLLDLASRISECTFSDQARLAESHLEVKSALAGRDIRIAAALAASSASDQYKLGRILELLDEPSAKVNALKAFQNAALLGHEDAGRRVMFAYLTPGTALFSLSEVKKRVPELIKSNDQKRIFATAEAIRRSLASADEVKAQGEILEPLYRRAAVLNHAGAMREYGLSLQRGSFTAKDPVEASIWLAKSSDLGDKLASRQIARAYLLGFGVKQSIATSEKYLIKASALGDKESAKLLESLKSVDKTVAVQ